MHSLLQLSESHIWPTDRMKFASLETDLVVGLGLLSLPFFFSLL